MKILAGLSGGVDSAVAAYLLKQQGHDVMGVTMSTWDDTLPSPSVSGQACLGPEEKDIEAARAVADALKIPFRVIDCREEYKKIVIENFKAEYKNGRTPNPCIWCNAQVKFGVLPAGAAAAGLQFDKFATGHYARVNFDEVSGKYRLLTAVNFKKDQSYFLYRLTQEQLSRTLFPLGALADKAEVRAIARSLGLAAADKEDSQDFYCGDYNDILKFSKTPGDIVDTSGKVVGRHEGIWNYTIGKRKGLGISGSSEPVYVVGIDAGKNRVIVGVKKDLYKQTLTADTLSWTAGVPPAPSFGAQVKIRAGHDAQNAQIVVKDGFAEVVFEQEQSAITAGQSAVFYDGDVVLGGGIIK